MTSASSPAAASVSDWERRLRDAAIAGEDLNLASADDIDPAGANAWPISRCIPTAALRRVLAFTDEKTLDPCGLRIRGARFFDEVNLAHIDFPRPLHFLSCAFDAGIDLNGSKLKELSFAGSHLRGLAIDNAEVLEDVFASDVKAVGKISAKGVKIGGRLIMTGAKLSNEQAEAIDLDSARVGGEVLLNKGFEASGEILALAVRIGGQLNLRGATLRNPGADALSLDSAEISGGVLGGLLYGDTVAQRFTVHGTIRALEAHIGGPLELDGAVLQDPNDYALRLDRAEIQGKLILTKGFTAVGTVRAVGARIGDCDATGAKLSNCRQDAALDLDGAAIGSRVLARRAEFHGPVSAVGASIKGDLDLSGATLFRCLRQVAVNLDRAEIGGDLLATDGFESHATIRALTTRIGGKFDLTGAILQGSETDALLLRSATIGRLVLCSTRIEGVDLSRAEIAVLETDEDLPTPLTATGWKVADLHGTLRSDTKTARRWLNSYPDKVKPVQPFWALADVYERNGDAAAARRMRFFAAHKGTTQSTLRRPALLRGTYGAIACYGYYPIAALVWLCLVIGLGYWTVNSSREFIVPTNTTLAVAAMQTGNHQPLTAAMPCSSHPGYPCWDGLNFTLNSLVSAWGNPSSDWTIRPEAPIWIILALFLLKVLAWGLLGLLLAGVTGLLRKS